MSPATTQPASPTGSISPAAASVSNSVTAHGFATLSHCAKCSGRAGPYERRYDRASQVTAAGPGAGANPGDHRRGLV